MRKGGVLYPVVSVVIIVVCTLLTTFAFAADHGGSTRHSFTTEGRINLRAEKVKSTEIPEAQKAGAIKTYGKLPLYFIENTGQVDGEGSYYERGAGHATFFTREGVVISLARSEGGDKKIQHQNEFKGKERRR